jgi:UDP-3-O-[3-hydroxymyristoyl] glucosamine N-acyltransferase
MAQPSFFNQPETLTLGDIADITGAQLADPARAGHVIKGLAVLDQAGPSHLTFFDNKKYLSQLAVCRAGACFVKARFEGNVPKGVSVLRAADPFRAFVTLARRMFPDALRPRPVSGEGVSPTAHVDPTAHLEDDVTVEHGAVIGAGAQIGSGTLIGPNAVIGPHVHIGRNCVVGAGTTIICTLMGNNVTVHPGCHIGQDGYGYVPAARGHVKIPQVGRVVIQDSVEIGAGTTIDRGALRDTTIGEGTKIDNLVQIGHNVAIGRHCFVVAQTGISGSATVGDGVALGARVGVGNHAVIGDGAQVSALSIVWQDLAAGGFYGGFPAKPYKKWLREMVTLEKLAEQGLPGAPGGGTDQGSRQGSGQASRDGSDEGTGT